MSANAQRWLKSFLAVMLGNGLYFSLSPHLPPAARHQPFEMDIGILVDLWFCLVVYGVLDLANLLHKRGR